MFVMVVPACCEHEKSMCKEVAMALSTLVPCVSIRMALHSASLIIPLLSVLQLSKGFKNGMLISLYLKTLHFNASNQ